MNQAKIEELTFMKLQFNRISFSTNFHYYYYNSISLFYYNVSLGCGSLL